MADAPDCPIWVKQRAVAKIRCQHQVGFKKALLIYKKKASSPGGAGGAPPSAAPGLTGSTHSGGTAPSHRPTASGRPGAPVVMPGHTTPTRRPAPVVSSPSRAASAASYSGAVQSPRPGASGAGSSLPGFGLGSNRPKPAVLQTAAMVHATLQSSKDDSVGSDSGAEMRFCLKCSPEGTFWYLVGHALPWVPVERPL